LRDNQKRCGTQNKKPASEVFYKKSSTFWDKFIPNLPVFNDFSKIAILAIFEKTQTPEVIDSSGKMLYASVELDEGLYLPWCVFWLEASYCLTP
jgi:hypothetical protein